MPFRDSLNLDSISDKQHLKITQAFAIAGRSRENFSYKLHDIFKTSKLSSARMAKAISIVGTSQRVVEAPGLSIDELAGNVASKNDRISIARVQ